MGLKQLLAESKPQPWRNRSLAPHPRPCHLQAESSLGWIINTSDYKAQSRVCTNDCPCVFCGNSSVHLSCKSIFHFPAYQIC